MTINETKREIQTIYRDWPMRSQNEFDPLSFYAWVRNRAPEIIYEGNYGVDSTPYKMIQIWVAEWEKLHVVPD